MANIIVALVILGIIGAAIAKIISEKKKGAKCVGCSSYSESSKSNCCDTHK